MKNLLKNWKVLLLLAMIVFSFITITVKGIELGVDFQGGTMFQIHLAEPVKDKAQMAMVEKTIQQRLDWTGLKDTKVSSWGEEFVIAQIAETDPEQVEKLETTLLKQGKFEVYLKGKKIFDGSDILRIIKDPRRGYGFAKEEGEIIRWQLPFMLKSTGDDPATKRFAREVFHQCEIVSFDPNSGKEYDCEKTYFFIDKPINSIYLLPRYVYDYDSRLLLMGNMTENIPQGTEMDVLIQNIGSPTFIIEDDGLAEEQKTELQGLVTSNATAIIPNVLDQKLKDELVGMGYRLKEVEYSSEGGEFQSYEDMLTQAATQTTSTPWLWDASGARQVISLTESVVGLDPYVEDVKDAPILDTLVITGVDNNPEFAQESLSELTILLESGSLPVPVDDISKETISPLLGKEFLASVFWIGLVALIIVSLVIFIRYKNPKLAIPIMLISLSEVYLILGFASLINWKLDLAAVAGILAAVGTGVDSQIIITDELLRGEGRESSSLLTRAKKAFFIIAAAASTTSGTMFPIIFFNLGFGKLVGFAITTLIGVFIGVFISRPAFSEIARHILRK